MVRLRHRPYLAPNTVEVTDGKRILGFIKRLSGHRWMGFVAYQKDTFGMEFPTRRAALGEIIKLTR